MTYISNLARSEGDPKILRSGASSLSASDRLAKGLGWFSLGLGLVELIAPERITRALGLQGKESLVRTYGAREICSAMLSLSPDKRSGLWSRLAGDGIDIATLMTGLRDDNPKRDNVRIALALVLGMTLLDVIGAQSITARHNHRRGERRLYHERSGFPKGIDAAKRAAEEFKRSSEMPDRARQNTSADS